MFGGSGLVNLAGFASNLAMDPEVDRRRTEQARRALQTGRTSDGRVLNDAQRKTLQENIARRSERVEKLESPDSFTNRAYAAADRMADTGAAFQESAKKGLGMVGSTVVDAAVSMGQSTLDAALGAATGTGMLPFVARALGGGTQEARRGGADLDKQLLYGSAQAAKEYVTEKLFGLAVPQRMLGRAGAGSLDDAIETGIRKVTERLAKTPGGEKAVGGLLTWLAGGATEGLEEGIGSLIENTLINPNLRDWDPDTRTREQKFEDGLYDMLVGSVSGLMGLTNLAAYNVSPVDAHVRGTLEMMNRAAGRETALEAAQEAPGARLEAGRGTDASAAQSGAVGAQTGPENIFTQTADAIRKEGDQKVRETLELMQRAAGMETGTAQQETAPETGTVVSENGARNQGETVRIINRLKSSVPQLATTAPVAFTSVSSVEKVPGSTMAEKGRTLFNAIKGVVSRAGFGEVEINNRSVKNDLSHGVGPVKAAVIPAIPEVIRSGKQIDFQENWKGRPYDGYVFAAPVILDGSPVYVAAIVKRTSKNRLYLHEVVDSTGNIIKINNEVQANPTSLAGEPGAGTQTSLPVEGQGLLNINSTVPQGAENVNPSGTDGQGAADSLTGSTGYDTILETAEGEHLYEQRAREDQDVRQESHGTFIARNRQKGFRTLQSGRTAFGVRRAVQGRDSGPAWTLREELTALGIPCEIIDGRVEWNRDGKTRIRTVNQAATLGKKLVAVSEKFSMDPKNAAGHEAFHFWEGSDARQEFEELLRNNLIFTSEAFQDYQSLISQDYFGQEVSLDAEADFGRLMEEISAYIAGDLHSGAHEAELRAMFRDYDAVRAAWEALAEYGRGRRGTGDGLGAADAGSLNSDYDRLQAQSDTFHPEGANAARPVDVPARDFEGRNVSKAASTVMGAQILDDADAANLEQMVADGAFSFDTIHDKDAIQKAQDTVRGIGFDRALERYLQTARANTATKDNMVLGQILMAEAARGGNRKALAEICSLYARNSTNIAQAMQAQRILRQLGPEARLYALQNSVNELSEKYGMDIELDQTALADFMNAENEEGRQAAEARLIQSAASQLPTTFRAQYDAARYLAMLGNPRTHFRNFLGNLAFQIPATVKNRVGALAERGAQALGADVERTKSLTGANPFGALAREARADWANAKPFLEGSKYSEGKITAGAIEREAKPFQNSNALGKAVGLAADKNGALLELEDNLFKQWTYSQSLAGYLQANGVKSISQADPALLNRARNYAAQEALRNTFNDRNDVSDFVARLGNLRNSKNKTAQAASYFTEGLLPFKRTPANVAVRAMEYSPVGAATSIWKLFSRAKTGKATQETIVRDLDRLAAGLSGSALLWLGWLLSGTVTGGEDPDEDQRRFDDLIGRQAYALELENGTSVTLDWLSPSAIPFFMGVELAHAWQDGGVSWEDAVNTLKTMTEPMLEMSMLQGLNDVFEDAAYAQRHGGSVLGAALVSAAAGYLTQVFPTFLGQMERAAEDKRMTTYADENSRVPKDLQFFLGKLSQKVPQWDYQQIPYLDAWGREEETGDPVERVFNNFFNPAYVSQVQVDAVEKELQRVADSTGNTGVFPDRAPRYFIVNKERKNLTAEEYQTYARRRGQLGMEVLRSLLNSPGYQNLSEEKKAEAISDAYSYADAMGKMAVSDYRPGDGTVAAGALKTMLPPSAYILYRMNKDRDGDGKETNLETTQTLQELPDLSGKQRGEAWEAMNKGTNPARNPFTGALAEEGMTPVESAAAWEIYGRRGTREEPYTESKKKQDLREELDLTDQEVRRIWDLMVKAAER